MTGFGNPSCYLKHTCDCDETASREHLMSKGILKQVEGPSTGYRWLKGQSRELPPSAFQSWVLCKSHNERLSRLDEIASKLFAAMWAAALGEDGPTHLLINGHDLERWIVQRACAVLHSGNGDYNGFKVGMGDGAAPYAHRALLNAEWPEGGGLYLVQPPKNGRLDGFEMAPFMGLERPGILVPRTAIGFRTTLIGVAFGALWYPEDALSPEIKALFEVHRPEGVNLLGPTHRLEVRFTWDPKIVPGPIAEYGPLSQAELDALWDSVGGRPTDSGKKRPRYSGSTTS